MIYAKLIQNNELIINNKGQIRANNRFLFCKKTKYFRFFV